MAETFENEYKRICAVVVTYGDRGELAARVIERCFEEGLRKVILIDNASGEKSKEKLCALRDKYGSSFTLITLPHNTGSAGGFKKGLQSFYEERQADYVLMLDDDNLPSHGSIVTLLRAYLSLRDRHGLPLAVFACRKINGKFTKFVLRLIKTKGKFDKNSFFGFNVLKIPLKIAGLLTPAQFANTVPESSAIIPADGAPYGTLFFHRSIIDMIGYPKEEMFLYMDDLEYTSRIINNKGRVYMVISAVVEEIDRITWKERESLGMFLTYLEGDSLEKIYYASRNGSFFESHVLNRSRANLFRLLNRAVYLCITMISSILLSRFSNWLLILKAVRRGEKKDFSPFAK